MLTRDFDFELPATSIAQEPAPRGTSRLLVVDAVGGERHRHIAGLPALLRAGDLLVVNDTRVIPARLFGRRLAADGAEWGPEGGQIELLLVEKCGPTTWEVLARPGKKARPGSRIDLGAGVVATVTAKLDDGRHRVELSAEIEPVLDQLGHVPLPPYIKRPDEAADRERYQTVFAREPGAIAAPTAGLHFTPELLADLATRGVRQASVTLHVGIGTFKPVTAELVHEHVMESERYEVPPATAEAITAARERGGRVVAVGTTVVRTLESAAVGGGLVAPGPGRTRLFITPGYNFQVVDALLTNFHLPCSTLLMLVSAFAGKERILAAYREAVAEGYRFYSYGDAMFVTRPGASAAPTSPSTPPRRRR